MGRFKDLSNTEVGGWKVLSKTDKYHKKKIIWNMQCRFCKTVVQRPVNNPKTLKRSKSCLECSRIITNRDHLRKSHVGEVYGLWTIENSFNSVKGKWWAICVCGQRKVVTLSHLKRGVSASCGCLANKLTSNRTEDLSGKEFGKYLVIKRVTSPKKGVDIKWLCKCLCGNESIVLGKSLKSGSSTSCGRCLQFFGFMEYRIHPQASRKIRGSKEYTEWKKYCLSRDCFKCTKCENTEKLEVHHIVHMSEILRFYNIKTPAQLLNHKIYTDPENGITLCYSCHDKVHSNLPISYSPDQFKKAKEVLINFLIST